MTPAMIAYFALHQLGYGDIMLPVEAIQDEDGLARVEVTLGDLVGHNPREGRVYYDAVSCYNEDLKRVKLFAAQRTWVKRGEQISISANEN